ncbi:sugar ABC transporter permease [Streptomyces albidus (ex Kaewkla and Franco 2022)]|uniref:carbohydrate ABC transporter permease n=1 Tax=Streptomyces albidus (ex Kaewkla and Franco 2022) TaxID=722709 RepID=UPI002814C220|nr:sugar ABC transporter permease [Streptomyces albidus (ex Kaewkla and Franco 2022)]
MDTPRKTVGLLGGAPRGTPPRGKSRRRTDLTPYAFLLPGVALFCLVVAYPLSRSLQISFYDWAVVPTQESRFIGFDNYLRGLQDGQFWLSMANVGVYLVVTVPGQIAIGMFLAVLLDARLPARGLFRVLFYLPVVTSWVVVALLFKYLFTTDGGAINWVLHDMLHLVDHNVPWLQQRWTGLLAVCALGIWKGVGWSMVIFLAALTGVSSELKDAAAIDGANAWQRFVNVSLPAIRRTLLFVIVMLIIGGFNVFISILLMTEGGPAGSTEVPLTYMYKQAFDFLDFGYASALSFLLAIVIAVISFVQFHLFRDDAIGARR